MYICIFCRKEIETPQKSRLSDCCFWKIVVKKIVLKYLNGQTLRKGPVPIYDWIKKAEISLKSQNQSTWNAVNGNDKWFYLCLKNCRTKICIILAILRKVYPWFNIFYMSVLELFEYQNHYKRNAAFTCHRLQGLFYSNRGSFCCLS